jgi:hypothetical protein
MVNQARAWKLKRKYVRYIHGKRIIVGRHRQRYPKRLNMSRFRSAVSGPNTRKMINTAVIGGTVLAIGGSNKAAQLQSQHETKVSKVSAEMSRRLGNLERDYINKKISDANYQWNIRRLEAEEKERTGKISAATTKAVSQAQTLANIGNGAATIAGTIGQQQNAMDKILFNAAARAEVLKKDDELKSARIKQAHENAKERMREQNNGPRKWQDAAAVNAEFEEVK